MAFKQQWVKTVPGVVVTAVAVLAMLALGNVAQGDLVTRYVQTDHDDAEEYLTNFYAGSQSYELGDGWLDSSDVEVGSEFDPLCWTAVGLQFDQLGIPQGATILSAKVTFTVDENVDPGTSNDFTILGEAAGNAAIWNGYDSPRYPGYWRIAPYEVTSRARTSASVGWSPTDPAIGATIDTPDISSVIQEIVDQGGWSDNNRLSLMIFPDAYLDSMPLTTTVTSHTYESGDQGTQAPLLTVEWVPEPSTLILLGMGALGLVLFGRRKRA